MTKRLIQRAAFLVLLTLLAGLAMLPVAETEVSAVPFCSMVQPGFPCQDLCYCDMAPHWQVVPANCCESSAYICQE